MMKKDVFMKTRVSINYCNEYELQKVKEALLQNIENLGGVDKFINKGDKVLLKANLIMKKSPESAAITHYVFVWAMSLILLEYGAEVLIGDSPGGSFDDDIMNSIYKAACYTHIEENTEAKLNRNYKFYEKDNSKGFILKKINMVDMVNDVDKIISLSKLKTHGMMTFTGAVKNQFGLVHGASKAEYHLNMANKDDFANALIDVSYAVEPVLYFMDGIEGMEGQGPTAGNARKLNVILGSSDPFALDKTACEIVKIPFEKVPILVNGIKRNLTDSHMEDVEIVGGQIKDFAVDDFEMPNSVDIIPIANLESRPIIKFVANMLKPKMVFSEEKCIGCKACYNNCPPKVIRMNSNNKATIKYKGKCIRCLCCQELCPVKAIEVKDSKIFKPVIEVAYKKFFN